MSVRFTVCLILILTSRVMDAQDASGPLTLEKCIQLAQEAQSPSTVAGRDVDIAQFGVTEARSAFLPQIQINNGFAYNSPLLDNRHEQSYIALNGIREYNSQLTTTWEVDASGRLRAALERARADRDAATAGLSLARRDLKRAVTASYYRLLLARHLEQSAQGVYRDAQEFERRVRLLFENGEAAQADLVKAASQAAFLEQAAAAARLDAQTANHELAAFWTTEVDRALDVRDDLEQPAPSPAEASEQSPSTAAQPYSTRPEFSLLDAQRRGFLADSRRTTRELFPQLNLSFQYGWDSVHLRARDRGYAVFATLNIPVFDWSRTRSQARQFTLKAQQIEVTRSMTERTFSREYQDALARVRQLYQQIAVTEKQVSLSEDNLRLSRIRYEGGEGLALDVVAAQNQLAQARAGHFSTLAAYFNARADLEVATGR